MRRILLGLILAAILAVVAFVVLRSRSSEASHDVQADEELYSLTFDEPGQWEEGEYVSYRANTEEVISETALTISDGRYLIDYETTDPSFTFGASGELYDPVADVIIDVESDQLGGTDDNLYGVVCRLTLSDSGRPTGGYALLISGDGYYSIAQLQPTTLEFLLEWHQSDVIKQGRASNTIRGICADDYLAITVNGEFLGEVTDVPNTEAGQVALIAGTNRNNRIQIAFDNLTVRAATLQN